MGQCRCAGSIREAVYLQVSWVVTRRPVIRRASTKESADEGKRNSDERRIVGNSASKKNERDKKHSNGDESIVIHEEKIFCVGKECGE